MSTVIHTTISELQKALAPFDVSRRVSVIVEDATEDERRAQIKQIVEAAADDPESFSDEEVFGEIRQNIREKYGL